MFLKQLDIFGFKSFADKVSIEFVPGITAVVGPNGSGKSNITDALRWVLGEQSAKSLRGGTMEDVIFAGSDSRKPLNVAEVSMTLNNESRTLPIDFSEVNVKRRVYRTGDSEFFINNEPCRLKDIVQLFLDSGLGKEAFSIISQGQVDQVLNSKPEERRTIFEEAAGVLKYKLRKKEAEGKLQDTEANLQRVNDILHELEGQLEPLKVEAEKAATFLKKKGRLKQFDIALTVHEIDAIHDQWQLAKLNFEKASDAEIEKATEIQRLEANIQKGRQRMIELDEQIAKQQSVLLLVTEQLEKLEGERQLFQERQKNSAHQQSQLQERLAVIEEKVTELQKLQQKTTRVIAEKKDDIELAKHALHEKNEQLIQFDGTVEKEIEQLKNKYIERLNGRTSLKNERHFINKQLLRLEARLEKLEKDDEKYIVQKETVEQQLQKKEASRETLEKEQSEQSKVIQEMQNELQYVKNQLETKQSKLFQTYHKIQKAKAREESLEAMSREFTGYFQGVKEVLKAKNEQRLHGIEGPVVDLIRVEKRFETAVDTALGGTAQHVVVQDEKMGRNAIHFLKENQLGRATFLPMTVIKGKQLHNQQQLLLRNHPAFIGVADELVSYEQKYDGVIKHLLGNIVVALHLQGANELAKLLQYRVRIVTLNGEVIHPGGAMTGGATIRKRSSLVGRKRELEQLREKITVMESEMELLSDEVDAYQLRITTQQKELSTLQNHYQQYERKQHQLEAELTRLTISLDHAIEQLTYYELEKEELLSEHDQLVKRRDEIAKELSETENEIAQLNITIESLTGKQSEEQSSKERLSNDINELTAKLAVFNEQLTGANVELARLQNEWVDADKRKQELLQQLHMLKQVDEQLSEIELERQITKQQFAKDETTQSISKQREERFLLQEKIEAEELELKEIKRQQATLLEKVKEKEMKVHRLDLQLENRLTKLREKFSLSYEAAKEKYPLTIAVDEAKEQMSELKEEVDALGTVHTGAIDEYERIHERYQFLFEQQIDLLEAKDTLFIVMDEMDSEMKKRFKHTFEKIQLAFEDVFRALFGGGKAKLKLTDPDDLLNTGVDIVAQPPGKKLQNLSLLSGGERSMTAIALLFSILKVRPVPFCVLDEVEAALDEANIDRFSNYLKHYSEETQFIVITHRQGTMAGADVLYGVTMQESGVSKLVSVKLEESKVLEKI